VDTGGPSSSCVLLSRIILISRISNHVIYVSVGETIYCCDFSANWEAIKRYSNCVRCHRESGQLGNSVSLCMITGGVSACKESRVYCVI